MRNPQWWKDHNPSINGIFKGGGAKGLLYAGAAQAVYDSGRWFRAVAGSSAGAITATLIAAGLRPEELTEAARTGPAKVRKNWLFDVIGRPFIRVEGLRTWLEEALAAQLVALGARSADDKTPVTFEVLQRATGIELFVVAVDVVRRQPIVFSHATTPGFSVTEAVMASSAIPIAFRPGRLEVEVGGETHVHRLIDGGVWANYPAFVFKDRSFREHHGLGELPEDSTTIGFTLEHRATHPTPEPKRLLTGWHGASGDRGGFLKGWLRNAPVRLYFLTLIPLVLAAELAWTLNKYGLLVLSDNLGDGDSFFSSLAGFFDGLHTQGLAGQIVLMTILAMVALMAIGSMFLAATLLDSAIPAIRSLMAVGTNVPYWVGTTDGDHLVRLTVPDWLGTLKFNIPEGQASRAIEEAHGQATGALADILPEREEAR